MRAKSYVIGSIFVIPYLRLDGVFIRLAEKVIGASEDYRPVCISELNGAEVDFGFVVTIDLA